MTQKETITVKIELNEGDLFAIRNGVLDIREAIERSLSHGHNLEIVSIHNKPTCSLGYLNWRHKNPCPTCGGDKEPNAKLCRQCYSKSQGPDGNPVSEQERFWLKVDKNGPIIKPELGHCWIWKGTCGRQGYGRFPAKRGGKWKKILAHRYAYEILVGEIADWLEPDHLCRNTACVNPAHLEPVTHQENMLRGQHNNDNNYNFAKTHCPQGHLYNDENTYKNKNGYRACRICHRESERKRRLK